MNSGKNFVVWGFPLKDEILRGIWWFSNIKFWLHSVFDRFGHFSCVKRPVKFVQHSNASSEEKLHNWLIEYGWGHWDKLSISTEFILLNATKMHNKVGYGWRKIQIVVFQISIKYANLFLLITSFPPSMHKMKLCTKKVSASMGFLKTFLMTQFTLSTFLN